jgi:hypothetical protein
MAANYKVEEFYGQDPNLTDPDDPFALAPVTGVVTLPEGTFYANVEITAGGATTLANPTTLVEGQRYVVKFTIGTGGTGATLSLGTDWVKVNATAFDATAVGDVGLVIGDCIGGKIYCQVLVKSAD